MKSKIIVRSGRVVVLAAAALAVSLLAADSKSKRLENQTFMRIKLAWSQAAVEGLTLEKFNIVSQNAIRMRNMTQSNQWFTMRHPDYLKQTTNYQKSVDALYMAAVDKKLDEATEAYIKMTRNCVECHRLVRAEQRKNAGLPVKPASEPEFRQVIIP